MSNSKREPLPGEPKVHIPALTDDRAIRMSNRQYSLLRFLDSAPKSTLTIEEVSNLNQLTLGANKRRQWLTETKDKHGVQLTYEGKQALKQFENGNFLRSVASMRFSSFLSLESYDDAGKPKRKSRSAEGTAKRHRKQRAGGAGGTVRKPKAALTEGTAKRATAAA